MKKAVLIVNLGSPYSYEVKDVKRYLGEFLMDGRVIDVPKFLRWIIVKGIVLNFRPKKSAAAYKSIWWDEGSPLMVISHRFFDKLDDQLQIPAALGMRYGNPSIASGIESLLKEHSDLEEILLVPLYPHYAMSSYETVVVKAEEEMKRLAPGVQLKVMDVFFKNEEYIEVLADSIRPHLNKPFDRVMFSYHGIPERHVRKSDPTNCHCLKVDNCCQVPSEEAHAVCYRHQVFETTYAVAKKLGLRDDQFDVTFQSRLGSDPWLQPFTDKTLEAYPENGVRNLVVVCPAFVADCLETLEEIAEEGKEEFMEAGGKSFTMVPCLNDRDDWVALMAKWIHEHTATPVHA